MTSPRGNATGSSNQTAARASTARATATRSSASARASATRPKAAAAAGDGPAGMAADTAAEDEAALSGGLLHAADVKARMAELIGEDVCAALADPQWKVRWSWLLGLKLYPGARGIRHW